MLGFITIETIIALAILGITTTFTYALLTTTITELNTTSITYKEIISNNNHISLDHCQTNRLLECCIVYKCKDNDSEKLIITDQS